MYGEAILVVKGCIPADTVPVREDRVVCRFHPEAVGWEPRDWDRDDWAQWLGAKWGAGYYRVFQPRGLPQMEHFFQGYVERVRR